jgi:hypothetical protein
MSDVQMQDENGNWVEAQPVGLMCEHPGCTASVTMDDQYERVNKNLPNGWEEEPEFLCKKHAEGRTPIRKLKPLPNYGRLMSVEGWLKSTEGGYFIDYDGHGKLATEEGISDIVVYPSMAGTDRFRKLVESGPYTHVMWFNK